MNKRVALFGGTFDPIHLGHLRLALAASRECELDQLIIMPNYISPFKTDRKVTPGELRCRMAETLTHYDPALTVSRYEIRRAQPSYTFDTLCHFREELGITPAFLIGFDSVMTIETWYRGPELIRSFPLITGRRPDTDDREGMEKIHFYRDIYNARISVLELEPFEASSTDIRQRIREGQPVTDLLPPEVITFIEDYGLYQD